MSAIATIELGAEDRIAYRHTPPGADDGLTFVGFNALTGDMNGFEAALGEALRAAGHGTLWWDYRGQGESPVGADTQVGEQQIAADALTLLSEVEPRRPVLVGLSVGGLYAARAWLAGMPGEGLVLINTLRRNGARLQWINRNLTRMAEVGGLDLLKDLYLPLLTNEAWQEANAGNFLARESYEPIDRTSGIYRLLESGERVDWDLPYEALDLPVLTVTGLQDRVFYDAADVTALLRRLPRARAVEMADAGHLIPMERPADLAREILAFAQEIQ